MKTPAQVLIDLRAVLDSEGEDNIGYKLMILQAVLQYSGKEKEKILAQLREKSESVLAEAAHEVASTEQPVDKELFDWKGFRFTAKVSKGKESLKKDLLVEALKEMRMSTAKIAAVVRKATTRTKPQEVFRAVYIGNEQRPKPRAKRK